MCTKAVQYKLNVHKLCIYNKLKIICPLRLQGIQHNLKVDCKF